MAEKMYNVKIQMRTDTYENWYTNHTNDVPLKGEVCVVLYIGEQAYNEWESTVGPRLTSSEEDMPKYRVKIGDGVTTFGNLQYIDQRVAEILYKIDTDLDTVADLAGGAVQKTFKINGQALTGDEITIETGGAGIQSINGDTGPDVTLDADSIGALPSNGTAASATKLATGRTIRTNLNSTASATFNGTANITPGVQGTLPIANGGTGGTTAEEAIANLGITTGNKIFVQSTQPQNAKQNDLWLKIL